MTMTEDVPQSPYLFHWLPVQALEAFAGNGALIPRWRHFLLDLERFATGTSTAEEPMLWSPDEGKPREPCLVLLRERIEATIHPIESGETYHLTKAIRRLQRERADIAPEIAWRKEARERRHSTCDEYFVEGPIPWAAVIGIGFEDDGKRRTRETHERVRAVAESSGLTLFDMHGWAVGAPGIEDLDEFVAETCLVGIPTP